MFNRGVNGEETADMLARFDTDVIPEHPDLVLWQVGTNSVLRHHPIRPHGAMLHEGVARLKAIGSDVVLIDPQFAPKVLAKHDASDMVDLIALTAKQEECRPVPPLRGHALLARDAQRCVRPVPVAGRTAHE